MKRKKKRQGEPSTKNRDKIKRKRLKKIDIYRGRMKRRKREGERNAERRKTDGRKGKAWLGKGRWIEQSVCWREKERKCKKDVTQYVGYRGTRACERSFLLVALARSHAEFPA